jgi:hypothetical protein
MAVILQTPRTALFEDTDEPAMIAWPGPGTLTPARPPRGLAPRGYESAVTWAVVALGLLLVSYLAIQIIEVTLARSYGRLALGNVELASATTTNGHFSARVSLLPSVVLAAVLATVLTLATRMLIGRRRARNDARRPPEDDA